MRHKLFLALCLVLVLTLTSSVAAASPSHTGGASEAARPLVSHSVHLAGVAPVDHYVRIYMQGPNDSGPVYRGAPAMNSDWSWSWDGTLEGNGEWMVNIDAKSAAGVWLYRLDQFTLTTSATSNVATLSYQEGANGYTGTTDCYISDWEDGDEQCAFGSLEPTMLRLRKVDRKLTLLRFNLEALPAGAQIQHAFVALYAHINTNPSGPTLFAYQMLVPWSEAEATWLSPQPGYAWAEGGALGADTDHRAEYLDKLCRPVDDPINDTCGVIIPGWHQLDVTRRRPGLGQRGAQLWCVTAQLGPLLGQFGRVQLFLIRVPHRCAATATDHLLHRRAGHAHSHADRNADPHRHANDDAHQYADQHAHAHQHAHTDLHHNTNRHPNRYAHSHNDGHRDEYAHAVCHFDPVDHADAVDYADAVHHPDSV